MNASKIDLNADMAEGFGAYSIGHDEELLDLVTSSNVACGFHGGDPLVMQRITALAAEKGVAIGAHPGFNDLWGFGRRPMQMRAADLEALVIYQIGALQAFAAKAGARIHHVKPHGALYNMAAKDAAYANAIARAVVSVDPKLILIGQPNSEHERAAEKAGLAFGREGFCDRLYQDDGSLMSRFEAGAVLTDPARAAEQALRFVTEGVVITASGKRLPMHVDTLCIHGDEPGSVEVARAVREAFAAHNITVAPVSASHI